MKDRLIRIVTVIIVFVAMMITWFSININNLKFVELGDYALATSDANLIVTKEINNKSLKNNNVVYIDYVNKELTINTGLVRDIKFDNNSRIYTIESNNKRADIDSSCIIGKCLVIIPGLGYVINYLLTRDGFLLFIVLPLLLVTIYELFKFIDGIQNIKHK